MAGRTRRSSASARRAALPFLLAPLLFLASPGQAAPLAVTVDNLRDGDGKVRLSVFVSAAEWLEHSTDDHDLVSPAQQGGIVFHFDLPPGVYAIACFHDENANGVFDRNFLGLPREGYAFSRNVRPFLRAPSFASASFVLPPEGTSITIHMIY